MTEAFEIGISLALADGVSEGIAKAQRDADAVARAVGAGALSVQRLQKAGVAALTVMHSVRGLAGSVTSAELARGQAAPAPAASLSEPGDDGVVPPEGTPLTSSAMLVEPSAPGASPGDGGRVRAPEERMEAVHSFRLDGAPLPLRQQYVVPAMDTPDQADAKPGVPLVAPLGQQPPVWLPDRSEPAAAMGGAPVAAPLPRASAGVADGGPSAAPAVAGMRGAGSLGLRLDVFGGRRPDAVSLADFEQANRGSGPPEMQPAPAPAVTPAAPVAPVLTEGTQLRPAAQESPAAGSTVMQEAGEGSGGGAGGSGGSMQGDVFLDGALVGRWMSRYLSREAGRASAGPTGFDQRRNALLPGATVGA